MSRILPTSRRDAALDILKGVLVVIMVVYHAMNVFSTADVIAYSYVRFVSGSFILLSGYIIGRFQDVQFRKNALPESKRLFVRGVKLLLLFIVLNMLISITGFGNSTKESIRFDHLGGVLYNIFFVGVARAASFQILLPIAYVMISGPMLLWLGQRSRYAILGGFVLAGVVNKISIGSINAFFYALGFIGVAGGVLANHYKLRHLTSRVPIILGLIMLTEALMRYADEHLVAYAATTVLLVQSLYDLSSAIRSDGPLARGLSLLGRYSLLCYIGQIIFMQSLSRALSVPRWELGYQTSLIAGATVLVLLAVCACLQILQRRNRYVAKAYEFIFL